MLSQKHVRYQFKAKRHIAYINEVANVIWLQNDFKIPYDTCLMEAFRRHIEYLQTGSGKPPTLSQWSQ